MTIVLGLDPGKGGGVAATGLDEHSARWVFSLPLKLTEKDVCEWMRSYTADGMFAYIEKVHAMPGQGVTSMFSFGRNYGFLRGCLIALGIPFEEVSPSKWQREFGLVFPKDQKLTTTEKKNRHKARAQELFPSIKVTHAIADALLIMEWGRRQRRGDA